MTTNEQQLRAADEVLITIHPGMSLEQVQRAFTVATLQHTKGNKELAAGLMGISLKTLYTWVKKFEIARH